jgi:transcription elongation factor GreB
VSRAFKKESDTESIDDATPEPMEVLPAGTKNYITPSGAARLKELRDRLVQEERPKGLDEAGAPGEPARQRKLRQLAHRIGRLDERIATLEIVDPATQDSDRVVFGATVAVRDVDGNERTYQICGVDEADPAHGKISWISPIARALRSRRVGDEVPLRLPRGEVLLEILEIEYR